MSLQEIVTIAIVVGVAVLFVVRRALASVKGEKGSCKSCGDTCGCEIKSQLNSRK